MSCEGTKLPLGRSTQGLFYLGGLVRRECRGVQGEERGRRREFDSDEYQRDRRNKTRTRPSG